MSKPSQPWISAQSGGLGDTLSGFRRASLVAVAAVVVLLVGVTVASATEFTETKLTPESLTDHFARYGEEVAVSSTFRVTSAPQHHDSDGVVTGAIYCCGVDGGSVFFADDGENFDEFGTAIAASDEHVVVGASGDDDNGSDSGSVYVFEADGADGLTQTAKLLASDGAAGDSFGGVFQIGSGVAISEHRIVVGAPMDDHTDNFDKGSVYVFELDDAGGWGEVAKLIASDADAQDLFGWSVAASGDRIVVGAPSDDDNGLNSGSVYVFEADGAGGWNETAKLLASDPDPFNPSDRFGFSVAASGDRIVVGAPSDDDNGLNSGSVYVFEADGTGGWTETAKLLPSNGVGWSVDVSGDRIVVGAPSDDDNGLNSGAVYVFEPDGAGGWVETRLSASDGAEDDAFGEAVSVHGDVVVVGAVGANPAGATYIYQAATEADVTPPVLTVPDDISVEATSPEGAIVTFTATATDNVDPDPTVVCDPTSGSLFPIGDTTVTCTATDTSGNTTSDTFLVMVTATDATAPVLTVPDDISVEATSPEGAVVTFTASATDNVDPDPTVVCDPTSGSLFPIGDTTVTCTATDASGNTTSDTFLVTVSVGVSTFDGFISQVESLDLANGTETSLVTKIEAAQEQFIDGDLEETAETLQSLINQVDALEDKKLTSTEAAQIRTAALTLIEAIT